MRSNYLSFEFIGLCSTKSICSDITGKETERSKYIKLYDPMCADFNYSVVCWNQDQSFQYAKTIWDKRGIFLGGLIEYLGKT